MPVSSAFTNSEWELARLTERDDSPRGADVSRFWAFWFFSFWRLARRSVEAAVTLFRFRLLQSIRWRLVSARLWRALMLARCIRIRGPLVPVLFWFATLPVRRLGRLAYNAGGRRVRFPGRCTTFLPGRDGFLNPSVRADCRKEGLYAIWMKLDPRMGVFDPDCADLAAVKPARLAQHGQQPTRFGT